jgi:hypothetical protein
MKYLICDVCKKTIENPVKDHTLFHHAHVDICLDCQDSLDMYTRRYLRKTEAEHRPFDFQWYNDFFMDTLEKAVQRGKVDLR